MEARHYEVVKIGLQPAKRLSFWLNCADIYHVYVKSGDLWLHRITSCPATRPMRPRRIRRQVTFLRHCLENRASNGHGCDSTGPIFSAECALCRQMIPRCREDLNKVNIGTCDGRNVPPCAKG